MYLVYIDYSFLTNTSLCKTKHQVMKTNIKMTVKMLGKVTGKACKF